MNRLNIFLIRLFLSVCFMVISVPLFSQRTTREQYISMYKDIAVKQMNMYGIPASIIMAQACLESDNGNSTLAKRANNHFGIKCHNGWSGPGYLHDDDKKNECFRKYSSPEESFKDHSEFLKNGQRYKFLFSFGSTDYQSWAHGLKSAGYATNPKYAQLLIKVIEDNDLHKLDLAGDSQSLADNSLYHSSDSSSTGRPANVSKAMQKAEKRAYKKRLKEQKRQMKLMRKNQRKAVNKGKNSIY